MCLRACVRVFPLPEISVPSSDFTFLSLLLFSYLVLLHFLSCPLALSITPALFVLSFCFPHLIVLLFLSCPLAFPVLSFCSVCLVLLHFPSCRFALSVLSSCISRIIVLLCLSCPLAFPLLSFCSVWIVLSCPLALSVLSSCSSPLVFRDKYLQLHILFKVIPHILEPASSLTVLFDLHVITPKIYCTEV